jgi:predicted RNA-binding Zn-ribbon protein involved in translation (DUF1610 family)
MAPRVYCSCGRLLKIRVRHDGVVLQCPEHGVIWRYQVGSKPDRGKKGESHSAKAAK